MRIIRLQAEGFKRLVAVDISPEGDLVELRGNNGNGKSSVLDAIFAALGGAGAAPERPVRDGEESAVIRLDLGDLIVTRYFTAEGTTGLKVTTPDGASYSSAQTMLDKLVGAISFDPLAFRSLKPDEQAEELRKLVDIIDPETGEEVDLEELAKEREAVFAKRRDVNRDGRALKSRIDALPGVAHVPDDASDPAELRDRLASAATHNEKVAAAERRREEYEKALANYVAREAELEAELKAVRVNIENGRKALAELPEAEKRIDTDEVRAALEEAERIAENVRENERRAALKSEFETLRTSSEALTEQLKAIDKRRAEAISSAKMPVEGLELATDDDGKLSVLFDGVPFSQASDAERLRVSCAVAMAANPELRVLRLKDASLLDKAAIETLREMASSSDFQIWAEFVGDEGPGIVMEAGEVRGADKPEPLDKPRKRKAKAEPEPREGEVAKGGDLAAPSEPETPANPPEKGGDRKPADKSPAGPSTLFERMSETESAAPAKPKPRAMSEFTTKPKGE